MTVTSLGAMVINYDRSDILFVYLSVVLLSLHFGKDADHIACGREHEDFCFRGGDLERRRLNDQEKSNASKCWGQDYYGRSPNLAHPD